MPSSFPRTGATAHPGQRCTNPARRSVSPSVAHHREPLSNPCERTALSVEPAKFFERCSRPSTTPVNVAPAVPRTSQNTCSTSRFFARAIPSLLTAPGCERPPAARGGRDSYSFLRGFRGLRGATTRREVYSVDAAAPLRSRYWARGRGPGASIALAILRVLCGSLRLCGSGPSRLPLPRPRWYRRSHCPFQNQGEVRATIGPSVRRHV
jgi:hypothetical protein